MILDHCSTSATIVKSYWSGEGTFICDGIHWVPIDVIDVIHAVHEKKSPNHSINSTVLKAILMVRIHKQEAKKLSAK